MSYRNSNDNWQQMLLKLDELGVKPWFIHILVTRWKPSHVEYLRKKCSHLAPHYLFHSALRGALESAAERDKFSYISNRLTRR